MKRFLVFLLAVSAWAQTGNIRWNQVRPSDRKGITGHQFQMAGTPTYVLGHVLVYDVDGNAIDGGIPAFGGTLTNFTAGSLSPVFTTNVNTPTTTPNLTFSLSNAAAHTFLGNNTGGSAAPAYVSIGLADLPSGIQIHTINFTFDGGGSTLATGDTKVYPPVLTTAKGGFSCTIIGCAITADQSGSITIDVWKTNDAIPTSGNKISASAPITLSAAQKSTDACTLSGWTLAVVPKDIFGFSIATVSTVTRVVGSIACQ